MSKMIEPVCGQQMTSLPWVLDGQILEMLRRDVPRVSFYYLDPEHMAIKNKLYLSDRELVA